MHYGQKVRVTSGFYEGMEGIYGKDDFTLKTFESYLELIK